MARTLPAAWYRELEIFDRERRAVGVFRADGVFRDDLSVT
jgi:hypothetical protein